METDVSERAALQTATPPDRLMTDASGERSKQGLDSGFDGKESADGQRVF